MNKTKIIILCLLCALSVHASAEIDKIYHPYVEAYRSEIEYRMLYKEDGNPLKDDVQIHRLAVGHSFGERFSLEGYAIGENLPGSSFSVNNYELEGKLQLTEQGEYWADWGLLFDVERDTAINRWDALIGLLWEKEWDKFVGTINFLADYETGPGITDEFDTSLHGQIKYRLSAYFEPAIEFYFDEKARGIGPVFLGSKQIGVNRLNWELGVIFGLDNKTASQNLRFLIDYEF